jgi:cilia- and flagella-associated protein 298
MLSYYKKKEKEFKELDNDQDDAYLNQPWANTKQLKNSLHGQSDNVTFLKKR